MRRLFGSAKPKQPPPSLKEMGETLDKRIQHLEDKIKKSDNELIKIREIMKKNKSPASQNSLKQKALQLLKQKKMYETQRDQLMSQNFNIEQTSFATESLQATATTVQAMREANKTMKQQFKTISLEDIDSLYDDMDDLLETSNDIQESMGRSFSLPFEVDESELDDELAALGEDIDEEIPSYLTSQVPTTEPALDAQGRPLPNVPQQITL